MQNSKLNIHVLNYLFQFLVKYLLLIQFGLLDATTNLALFSLDFAIASLLFELDNLLIKLHPNLKKIFYTLYSIN